jgi:hypothetical protein
MNTSKNPSQIKKNLLSYYLQITLKKERKKYKLYICKQIQDAGLNTLSEAFLEYEIVILNIV